MAKRVALAVQPRAGSGKGEARALRRQGRVPAVAYGTELLPTPLSVDERELYHALHTEAGLNAIFRIDLDGETHLALAREIQRHPVRREVLHVDFVTVNRNVKVRVDVPIHLEGEAPGIDEGGVADQSLHTLSVEVLPLEVPGSLTLDISDMQIGDVKRVSDLSLPQGVETLLDPETTVVSVNVPQLAIPEPEELEEVEGEELAEGEVPEGAEEGQPAEGGERSGDDE